MARGRIAVIIAEIFDPLDYELMDGIHSRAAALGYDVIVLTGIRDARKVQDRSDKLNNIYSLIRYSHFDGVIFAAGSFYDSFTEEAIFNMLDDSHIPCVCIGRNHQGMKSIFPKQREAVRHITEHLISVHGCRSFIFLSGLKGEYNSEERYAGFREALENAGISFDEETCLRFGEYWKELSFALGKDIAEGRVPRPDAVVCANDVMAASLSEGLISGGIRVPEDVKVTGFDGEWFAMLHTPSLTTVSGQRFSEGIMAVDELFIDMTGHPSGLPSSDCKISYGTSCGCESEPQYPSSCSSDGGWIERGLINILERYMERGRYISGDLADHTSRASSLKELISLVYGMTDMFSSWLRLDICLCSDWQFSFEDTSVFRREGVSDNIQLVMDKIRYSPDGEPVTFPVKKLLPQLEEEHQPKLIVMTSLSCEEQVFGYVAFNYYSTRDICLDAQYMNWHNAVSSGFNQLQQRLYQNYLDHQNSIITTIDPVTGLFNQRGFLEQLSQAENKDIIVWYVGIEESGNPQIDDKAFHVTTTALRLISQNDEKIAVIGDKLFAAIIPCTETPPSETVFRRLLALERETARIQGNIRGAIHPVLMTKYLHYKASGNDKLLHKAAGIAEELKNRLLSGDSDDLQIRLYRLRSDIYIHPEKDLSIDDMAERMNFSRSYFQRIYKDEFGISCKDDVIAARLEKARSLLTVTKLPVGNIAEQCGYNEVNHFMRQFRDRTGMTALEYRRASEE